MACAFAFFRKSHDRPERYYTRLTHLPEANKQVKPKPVATRRRAKIWAVGGCVAADHKAAAKADTGTAVQADRGAQKK